MLALSFFLLCISRISAVCNYFNDAGDYFPLDTCSYEQGNGDGTYSSWGYYCEKDFQPWSYALNGTNRSFEIYRLNRTVGELMQEVITNAVAVWWYTGLGCTNQSSKTIWDWFDCDADGTDCMCEGTKADCKYAHRVAYETNNEGCNQTTLRNSTLVYGFCVDKGEIGGRTVSCDANGFYDEIFDQQDCTGTSLGKDPKDRTCEEIYCDNGLTTWYNYEGAAVNKNSGKKNNGGSVAGIVIGVLLAICCLGGCVGFLIYRRQQVQKEVYFDSNADSHY